MFAPSYIITNKILNSISKIEAAEEVIRHSPLLPLWEKQIQEIINYRKVIEFIDEEAKKKIDKITEMLVKKLHRIIVEKILQGEEAGEYRTKQVVIRNSQTGEVTFRPPSPIEVPFLMREFLYWINRDDREEIHPVLKAGIVHHELVRIHPFIDGNGRVARVLATLIFFLGGYDIRRFFSLEEYYDKDAVIYYQNLQKASAGNLSSWLEYFTYGASIEFDKIKEKILKLSKDVKLKERFGGQQIYLTERQVKIIEYIQEVGYLQNQSFASVFPDISEDSVLRDLQDLIKKALLKKVGSTKAARYVMM
ncbi:Fic family protein [Candidatus Roizmanbacteria bacterium]|nr:Fic family protein [Candidatus Roizmanbacteria bacterium]